MIWTCIKLTLCWHLGNLHFLESLWADRVTVCVVFFALFFNFRWWLLKFERQNHKRLPARQHTSPLVGHDVYSFQSSRHVFFPLFFARRPSCLPPVFAIWSGISFQKCFKCTKKTSFELVPYGNGLLFRIATLENLRRRSSASWPSDGWMARSFRNPSRCRRFGVVKSQVKRKCRSIWRFTIFCVYIYRK